MNVRRIPVPREHGAWAVLFASLLLAFAHVRSGSAVVLAVLFVLAFAIQQPLRELAAGRRGWPWVAAYGVPLVLGAGYLVLVHGLTLLIWLWARPLGPRLAPVLEQTDGGARAGSE